MNTESGGGDKSGSGRGVPDTDVAAKKGGRLGGKAAASRPKAERRDARRTVQAQLAQPG